jgi:hypothetical protein
MRVILAVMRDAASSVTKEAKALCSRPIHALGFRATAVAIYQDRLIRALMTIILRDVPLGAVQVAVTCSCAGEILIRKVHPQQSYLRLSSPGALGFQGVSGRAGA